MHTNTHITNTTATPQERQLVGIDRCRRTVFPDEETAPSIRCFSEWMARGYFPKVKVGRRVFLDPFEVRTALERRFTINAREM
ncbi:MAG: hypothetical protein K9M97_09270 [Akkermansiaceae bacterium]|nr:hypothetical protein [Akkermansiaceae bacterium]